MALTSSVVVLYKEVQGRSFQTLFSKCKIQEIRVRSNNGNYGYFYDYYFPFSDIRIIYLWLSLYRCILNFEFIFLVPSWDRHVKWKTEQVVKKGARAAPRRAPPLLQPCLHVQCTCIVHVHISVHVCSYLYKLCSTHYIPGTYNAVYVRPHVYIHVQSVL